jgi:hypothetical protein
MKDGASAIASLSLGNESFPVTSKSKSSNPVAAAKTPPTHPKEVRVRFSLFVWKLGVLLAHLKKWRRLCWEMSRYQAPLCSCKCWQVCARSSLCWSHHITLHDIISHHITSHHIISHHITHDTSHHSHDSPHQSHDTSHLIALHHPIQSLRMTRHRHVTSHRMTSITFFNVTVHVKVHHITWPSTSHLDAVSLCTVSSVQW